MMRYINLPFKTKEQIADLQIAAEAKRKNYKLTEPLPAHIAEELKTRPMNKKERALGNKYVFIGIGGFLFLASIICGISFGLYLIFTYVYRISKPLIVQFYENYF